MTTIAYTVSSDVKVKVALNLVGGEATTRLHLRIGIKDSEGTLYSEPDFNKNDADNTLDITKTYELKAGDTVYFIFSNGNSETEGAYPNGTLDIKITKSE